LESDNIREAGVSVALNVNQVIEIGRFVELKSFVGKSDNLMLNPLFNFDPIERFKNWSDVRKLWSLDTVPAVEFRMSLRRRSADWGRFKNSDLQLL